MQINRLPDEVPDEEMRQFYRRLLEIKKSRLFQEGKYELADISDGDYCLIALKVVVELGATQTNSKRKIGAIACFNIGPNTVSGRAREIGKDRKAEVYGLNDGIIINNPDMERKDGMYVKLGPWETQVIFYTDVN